PPLRPGGPATAPTRRPPAQVPRARLGRGSRRSHSSTWRVPQLRLPVEVCRGSPRGGLAPPIHHIFTVSGPASSPTPSGHSPTIHAVTGDLNRSEYRGEKACVDRVGWLSRR